MKLEAIHKYPLPKTAKEIKSFCGLIGYYRRFISNFAKIIQPMTNYLKKGTKIDINDPRYLQSFQKCKDLLSNAPVLQYPDFTKPFSLTTDASNYALGGVLSQSGKSIAFYSRTLNSAERNYSTIEKELLSIVDNCKHFRPYLYGRHFVVKTDHNPLVWLSKLKEPNSRLTRWRLKLEEYDFEVIYKKGKENKVADALSRIEINTKQVDTESVVANVNETPEISDEELSQLISSCDQHIEIDPQEMEKILKILDQDLTVPKQSSNSPSNILVQQSPNLNKTQVVQNQNIENDLVETSHSVSEDTEGKIIPISEIPVNYISNRIIIKLGETFNHEIFTPFEKKSEKKVSHILTIRQSHLQEDLKRVLLDAIKPDSLNGIHLINPDILEKPFCELVKQQLNQSVKTNIHPLMVKDVPEEKDQRKIINDYHSNNHNGINETYEQLKTKFYWPAMKKLITSIINKCEQCLLNKYERHPYLSPQQGPMISEKPFQKIHIDIFSIKRHKFLTIIDLFSKYAQAYHLDDLNTETILMKLRHYCSHHTFPLQIISDNGKQFDNTMFKEFCQIHKIKLHLTTLGNPNSNSPIERFHSTIVEKFKIFEDDMTNVPEKMITIITNYNHSVHSSTGKSPFFLLYPLKENDDLNLDIDIYEDYTQKRINELAALYKKIRDSQAKHLEKVRDKINQNRTELPNLKNQQVYVQRDVRDKTKLRTMPMIVTQQDRTKLTGENLVVGKQSSANLSKIKRVRKQSLLQDPSTSEGLPSQDQTSQDE